ncbi:unnamed protein product [Somion occarium]|uniref:Blue (type 1) copper domain-containing protein n=1 Tax=Somion occarium TaxID=3059160 RepID=A0ABP1DAS4_9APHY
MFTAAFAFLSLPLLALASPQLYGPPVGPSTPTTSEAVAASVPSAPPSTPGQINVDVGPNGSFSYNPNNITASNGTIITFFFPNAGTPHSVVESSFANPCTPLQAQGGNPAGFDSGLTMGTQFTLNVTNDQIPIYFFCKVPTHCGLGMVGAINAPTTGNGTLAALEAAASAIGANEPTIADNGPVTGGVGADATAPPASASDASTTGGSSPGSTSGATQIAITSCLGLIVVVMSTILAL